MRKFLIIITALVMSLILTACNNDGDAIIPTFTSVRIDNTDPVTGGEFNTYYRGKGDTVTVEISLNNPSNLKIKSVVINGYTHFSTKFDPTSTNSLITFNLDVGTTLAETIYSVDRVNYLDGENNSYVSISDDNEFRIYVYKDLPTVTRENYQLEIDEISIDFDIMDEDSVIQPDTLIAYLYAGETLIESKQISSGLTTVTFTGLLANRLYEVKIIGSYDLDDSVGVQDNRPLYSESYSTLEKGLPSASVNNVQISSNSVTFDVNFTDEDNVVVPGGLNVGIYNEDVLVESININSSTGGLMFEDLLNDKDYEILVKADYDLNDGIGVQEDNTLAIHSFSTLPREVPLPAILNMDLQENSIEFDVFIDDPNSVIFESTLYANLYIEGDYIDTTNIEQYHVDFQVNNLFANKDFMIEIVADYDLNNGAGIQEDKIIFAQIYNTLENASPTVNIHGIFVEQGYVTIDLVVNDANETLMGTIDAILYEGDTPVQTVVLDVLTSRIVFAYPTVAEENYYIEFVADYNLRDETGAKYDQVLRRIVSYTAEAKAPIAEIHNVEATTSSIDFDVIVIDADGTIVPGETYAYLYLGDTEIASTVISAGSNSIQVDNLLSNNQYTIHIQSDFNLDDGSGVLEDMTLTDLSVMTLTKELPSSDVLDSDQDQSSITIDVEIIDNDDVIEDGSVVAKLYHEGIEIDSTPLIIGENFDITFSGLLSDNNYTIIYYADYDLEDGNPITTDYEIDEITIKTDAKSEPSVRILTQDADQESITIDVEVTDDDGVITGNLKAVVLEYDALLEELVPTGEEATLNVGVNNNVTFTDVFAEKRYYINVVADYDLNDGDPAVTNAQLEQISLTTPGYQDVFGSISNVVVTTDTITFDTFVSDDNAIITGNLQVVLYKDDVATGDTATVLVGDTFGAQITGVESATDYTIKLEADYDLNLPTSPELAVVLDSVDIRTSDLSAPTAGFTNAITDYSSFEVDITVNDYDGTITANLRAELYEDGLKIGEQLLTAGSNSNVTFDTLYSNYDYEVRVVADYDLNDEDGEQVDQVIGTTTIHTDTKPLPVYTLTNVVLTKTDITFDIVFDDVLAVMYDDTMRVRLYVDDVMIDEINLDTETVSFDIANFIADFEFEIRFIGDYNLNDNQGDVLNGTIASLMFTTLANAVPEAVINDATASQESIEVDIDVTDVDATITGGLVAQLVDNTDTVLDTKGLVVGNNVISFNVSPTYQELYRVVVVADYNVRDASPTSTNVILAETVVSIYNKLIPEAMLSNVIVDETSITFDATVYDNDTTILPATTVVELYLDDVYQTEESLSTGANPGVDFTGLFADREYELRVVTDYDNGDGVGTYANQVLVSTTETTLAYDVPTASILEDSITASSIVVDVPFTDDDAVSTARTVVLYDQFDAVVETVLLSIGANDNVTFNTLYSNETYTVKVFADYDLNTGLSTVSGAELAIASYTTDGLGAPSATLEVDSVDADSITFTVDVTDDFSVITTNFEAVLYLNDAEVDSIALVTGEQTETFTGLDSNSEYLIKIETDYDVNERTGEVLGDVMSFAYQATEPVSLPSMFIESFVVDYDQFDVNITVVDNDGAITGNLKAVLYKGGIATAQEEVLTVGGNTITFDTLLTDNEYEVKVFADYDLEDGNGTQAAVEFDNAVVTTLAKAVPSIETNNLVITYDQVTFDVGVIDIDDVYTASTLIASLYDGVTLIASQDLLTDQVAFDVSGFPADYPFTIEITGDYNLDDGNGLIDDGVIATLELQTLAYAAPTAVIGDVTPGQNTVDTTIEVTDDDATSIAGTIVATLYDETDTMVDSVVLSVGANEVSFAHTMTLDEFYRVVVTANYDLLDTNGIHTAQILDETLVIANNALIPEALIENMVIDETSITFDVTVYDTNSTIIAATTYAQLYLGDSMIDDTTLDVGPNPGESFTGLESGKEYEVRIVTDYNLSNGNNTYTDKVILLQDATTLTYAVPSAAIVVDTVEATSIVVDIVVTDDDTLTTVREAVLYDENDLEVDSQILAIGDNFNVTFTGLAGSTQYSVNVELTYDLNDGEGSSVITAAALLQTTAANTVPSAIINSLTQNTYEIAVNYDLVDNDSITTARYLRIYDGGGLVDEVAIAAGAGQTHTFTALTPNTEYTVTIETTYDLNDDNGVQSDVEIATSDQATDNFISIENETIDKLENVLDVVVDDVDGILTTSMLTATLYGEGTEPVTYLITANTPTTVNMINLLSDFDYTLVISASYDIGNGTVTEDVYSHDFHTLPLVAPTVELNHYSEWTLTGSVQATVTIGADDDNVATDTTWTAYLYVNGNLTEVDTVDIYTANGSANPEDVGAITITFSGYVSTGNDTYTIVITADIDMNDVDNQAAVETEVESATGIDAGN